MTKLRLSFLILLCIIFQSAFSQRKSYDKEVYWGLNGGVSESMIYFVPTIDQSYLQGYNGGLIFRYIGTKSLGLQAEINYVQKGWSELSGLYSRQLNYIEVPFLTHFNFGNKFRSFFNIGPKFSYLISEKTLIDNTVSSTEFQHLNKVERPFEYGLAVGAGFYLRMSRQVIQVEARLNYSAIDIYPNLPSDAFDYSNNINATLNFAWLIQTNKKTRK